MSKLSLAHKKYFVLILLIATPCFSAKNLLEESKTLLSNGHRKKALKILLESGSPDLMKKSKLLAEQFMTAENFQKYQDAKAYAEGELWPECLKSLGQITPSDHDNLNVLKIQGTCELGSGLTLEANDTFHEIISMDSNNSTGLMGIATIHHLKKNFEKALTVLQPLDKIHLMHSEEREKYSILKARIYLDNGNYDAAIATLQTDHERNLDHLHVIYLLGDFYQKKEGQEWLSRRSFALFLSRYKKLSLSDPKRKFLEDKFKNAESKLSVLDKKLNIPTEYELKQPQ